MGTGKGKKKVPGVEKAKGEAEGRRARLDLGSESEKCDS